MDFVFFHFGSAVGPPQTNTANIVIAAANQQSLSRIPPGTHIRICGQVADVKMDLNHGHGGVITNTNLNSTVPHTRTVILITVSSRHEKQIINGVDRFPIPYPIPYPTPRRRWAIRFVARSGHGHLHITGASFPITRKRKLLARNEVY